MRRRISVLAACVSLSLLVLSTLVAAQPPREHPAITKVRSSVKDPSRPFVLLVSFQIKEGAAEKFEAAFAKASEETHKEKGCIAYDLSRDTSRPNHYLLYERWKSLADLEAHLSSEHMKTTLAQTGGLTAAPPTSQVFVPVGD